MRNLKIAFIGNFTQFKSMQRIVNQNHSNIEYVHLNPNELTAQEKARGCEFNGIQVGWEAEACQFFDELHETVLDRIR